MKVYVVRHGQSETNLQKKWTGWLDVALTERGVEDAKKAGQLLKNVPFDKIYASDLSRAVCTAQNALPGQRMETSKLLREYNVGDLAGQPLNVLTDEDRAQIAQDGYVKFHGESQTEFYNRVEMFKKELEMLDVENVAVFTHAGFVRGLLDTVVGIRLPRKNIRCENCTVAIYEYNQKNWKLHSWINL